MIIYALKSSKSEWCANKKLAQGCYLHGKLEEINGYDLFEVEKPDWDKLVSNGNGKERVSVFMLSGKIEIADMYYWKPTYYDEYEKAKEHYDKLIEKYKDYKPNDAKENYEIQALILDAYHKMRNHEVDIKAYPIRALVVLPYDTDGVTEALHYYNARAKFL